MVDPMYESVTCEPEGVCPPTAGCLFSGMGGFASGLVSAGFAIRWASDNDAFACATFRHRLPGVPLIEKDIRDLSARTDGLAEVDVLAAGFPAKVSHRQGAGSVSRILEGGCSLRFHG